VEACKRIDLVNFLLDEAVYQIAALQLALAAQRRPDMELQPSVPGMPCSAHEYNLQDLQDWWVKAQQGLTIARTAFEHIAIADDQHGDVIRTAGA
jgi:hypothetical protein